MQNNLLKFEGLVGKYSGNNEGLFQISTYLMGWESYPHC